VVCIAIGLTRIDDLTSASTVAGGALKTTTDSFTVIRAARDPDEREISTI
jgi:hypothetical protein